MKEIKITETAQKIIRRLFAHNSVNTLHSDPELTAIFDNFAFDENIKYTEVLDEKTRIMSILASTIGGWAMTQFKTMVNTALNVGLKPREIREVVYQSIPYVGFSRVIDFLLAMNDVFENNDIKLPLDDQGTTDINTRTEKGKEWMVSIFGKESIEQMFKDAPQGQEHINNFLAGYCFGDFYTRNGVTMQQRELMTFCFLASMGGTEPQMCSHAYGNKNVGNSKEYMVAAVTAMIPYIGFPRALNALTAINKAY